MVDNILRYVENGLFTKNLEITSWDDRVMIVPGFVDTHAHMAEQGFFMRFPSLSAAENKRELIDIVAQNIDREKKINVFVDYDDSFFGEDKIVKEDLDRVSKEVPIIIRRVCGHIGVLNSSAIKYFSNKINRKFVDEDTGIAREFLPLNLYDLLEPSLDDIKEGILIAQRKYLDEGITGICDFAKDLNVFSAYKELEEKGKLKIKVELSFYESDFANLKERGLYTGKSFGRLRIGGIKMFMDGSVGGRTASFYNAYKDALSVAPFYSHDTLRDKVNYYEKNGFKVLIHAIGTKAIDVAVAGLPEIPDFNHRIEHFEFPSLRSLKEVKKKNVNISMQPNFVRRWHRMYENALSYDEFQKMHPYKTMEEMEILFGFGSDSMPFGPLYGIHGAVNHPFPSQRLSYIDALKRYTEYAQMISGLNTGAFKRGFYADFVVIGESKVKSVYVEGKRAK